MAVDDGIGRRAAAVAGGAAVDGGAGRRAVVVAGGAAGPAAERTGGGGAGADRAVAAVDGPQADALRMVLSYLGPRHMGRIACTSRQGGALTAEDSVWKALCYRDFGILHRADECSWQRTYYKGWTEKVLYFMGQPDYVEYLGSVHRLQPRRLKSGRTHTQSRGSAEAA